VTLLLVDPSAFGSSPDYRTSGTLSISFNPSFGSRWSSRFPGPLLSSKNSGQNRLPRRHKMATRVRKRNERRPLLPNQNHPPRLRQMLIQFRKRDGRRRFGGLV
jgi:hypothetical protein